MARPITLKIAKQQFDEATEKRKKAEITEKEKKDQYVKLKQEEENKILISYGQILQEFLQSINNNCTPDEAQKFLLENFKK